MEQEFSNVPTPAKKNYTVLIVVVVVAVLLCCCCLSVVAALTLLGPTVGETFESIEEGIEQGVPYEMPAEGEDPFPHPFPSEGDEDDGETYGLSDYIPAGGLGDEVLRADTWFNVTFSAAMESCSIPADGAENTTIDVIQDPDSAGVWVERWTVPCDEGSPKSFDITFTPSASGGTDISIETAE
jgi:hypothetical protein